MGSVGADLGDVEGSRVNLNNPQFGPTPRYPEVLAWEEDPSFTMIMGPCSIEGYEQALECAMAASEMGATHFRGGVFSAGTYPGDSFGLRQDSLAEMIKAARKAGIRTLIEVIDIRDLDRIASAADSLQVGARQAQGYALLKEVSLSGKEVFLKAGSGMDIHEILGATEYLARGNCKPRIVIRGSSSFHKHCRWDLSVSLIAAIKRLTQVPVIVDASHGTGRRDLVRDVTLSGIAAGADGFLIEMHPDPDRSISDAQQAISFEESERIVWASRAVAAVRMEAEFGE